MTVHFDVSDSLLARILGRSKSLFAADIGTYSAQIASAVAGRRILVVGAAGSIGGAFVKQLVQYRPAGLHLVDLNENSLVELVRDLRSGDYFVPADFQTVAVDFGSIEFLRFLESCGGHDVFVNFSAMKHVRSERDVFSLSRMIDVNVRALDDYLAHATGRLQRAFSVSTDKSVRPVNLMGATKNLMERVLFSYGDTLTTTSARFANVAFSAGSLLEGFEQRLQKNQPLAAPSDTRRYFISHEEAGQLCLLSCFLGENREVFFPKMTADEDLMSFMDIAVAFLHHHGWKPLPCADDAQARAMIGQHSGLWPCVFLPSDTTGEKPFEEFHRVDDIVDMNRFTELAVVREASPDRRIIDEFLAETARLRQQSHWSKSELAATIHKAVPELEHVELGRNLDQKM
ncbi:polysaccharide biosynthesis protein [Magnetospirillum gryphiswaldense]|uniref:Nucleoside-diphosphate sugar epimerases n=1 Tax=Magnetospirillum gryphiswaldense TaxID=55518 RepID=A4U186_9PROT|nr:polysaccharide biosynthesis protein [Magnetospirillum gryphiswaldense]AVM75576.1 UDP-N-acetyl-alpha-D-glucosamine C6 dehydratase [Magnetospirillum gryphiswaldense MSR-1]AVM79479.1 UDP-N-acetyl-alpha-D-glucosamine C6 dehydratase [Magnetospirillum gryphiswaldense]CAM76643.1 nucleoside-diphosphate sugar epimerases [Magnetospirillum gryphiswaldense MSR-1]